MIHGRPSAQVPSFVAEAFTGILYDAEAALVVAPLQNYALIGRRPAIAWHPSPALDRAIEAAMPLLTAAERVTFIIGDPEDSTTDLPDLAATLRNRGIRIDTDRFTTDRTHDTGEQIRARALAGGADMLIMGAWTRPRFLEWLFGGPTQDVLSRATLPVLTHH